MSRSSKRSRRRWSRSWRRRARCRPRSPGGSRSRPGASAAPTGSEVEVLAFRAYAGATPGLALIRDRERHPHDRDAAPLPRGGAGRAHALPAHPPEPPGPGPRGKRSPLEAGVSPAAPRRAERTRPARQRHDVAALAPVRPRAGIRASDQAGRAHNPTRRTRQRSPSRTPNEPEAPRRPRLGTTSIPDPPASAPTLHEPAASWTPNEPETRGPRRSWSLRAGRARMGQASVQAGAHLTGLAQAGRRDTSHAPAAQLRVERTHDRGGTATPIRAWAARASGRRFVSG